MFFVLTAAFPLAKEVRSPDDHCIFLFINLPTAGVVPAAKSDFFLTAVTNILAAYSKNSIAIFVHGNRAGDAAGRILTLFLIPSLFFLFFQCLFPAPSQQVSLNVFH